MIDPAQITNYNQTTQQLEESILFWILAAGKNGTYAARCLNWMLDAIHTEHKLDIFCPFEALKAATKLKHETLTALLATHKTGAQRLKARTIIELINANIDLRECSREDLIKIWGIGLKSASCFILHSRPNVRIGGIDTHMLKFLRQHGAESTKVTKRNYLDLEAQFLRIADQLNMMPAECDLWVWNSFKVKFGDL